MITLDKGRLLGGGASARETGAGKIGLPKIKDDSAHPAPAIALDMEKLLVPDNQGRGAKIGPKNGPTRT